MSTISSPRVSKSSSAAIIDLLHSDPHGFNQLRRSGVKLPSLRHADLRKANLDGVDLSYLDLRDAYFSPKRNYGDDQRKTIEGADFSYTQLNGAQMSALAFRNVRFDNTDLSDANLSCCEFHGTEFSNVSLRAVNFISSRFNRVRIVDSDARGASFNSSRLSVIARNVDFRGANFRCVVFSDHLFKSCDLRDAQYTGFHSPF